MKDKHARDSIVKLARILGISADIDYGGSLEIDKWSNLDGADPEKRPMTRAEVKEKWKNHIEKMQQWVDDKEKEISELRALIFMLAGHMDLELFEGKEFRPKQKIKAKKSHVRN
jgi:hypothetical protein